MSQCLTAKESEVLQIPATVNFVFVSVQSELYKVTAFFSAHFLFMFSVLKKCLTLLFLEHSTSFSKQVSRKVQGTSQTEPQTQTAASPGVWSVWDPKSILLQNELEKVQMSVTTFPVVINYCHVCDNVPSSDQLLPLSVTTFPVVSNYCHRL